jgi:hypothetical protein
MVHTPQTYAMLPTTQSGPVGSSFCRVAAPSSEFEIKFSVDTSLQVAVETRLVALIGLRVSCCYLKAGTKYLSTHEPDVRAVSSIVGASHVRAGCISSGGGSGVLVPIPHDNRRVTRN